MSDSDTPWRQPVAVQTDTDANGTHWRVYLECLHPWRWDTEPPDSAVMGGPVRCRLCEKGASPRGREMLEHILNHPSPLRELPAMADLKRDLLGD